MRVLAACVVAACGLALAGCAKSASDAGSGALGAVGSNPPSSAPATTSATTPASTPTTKSAQPASDWPTPEDCVSYNPATLTVSYAGGHYRVTDGAHEVLTVDGQDGDMVGQQALALAQRYKKHCYIGRDNARADQNAYIFDYWRTASGQNPDIPGLDDLCSTYDKHNLTVEDMGGSDGWRVKDHDHVLHLFDTGTDAHNGAIVLGKYGRACSIGGGGDGDPRQLSFFLP
jgi:hypothetical protein